MRLKHIDKSIQSQNGITEQPFQEVISVRIPNKPILPYLILDQNDQLKF